MTTNKMQIAFVLPSAIVREILSHEPVLAHAMRQAAILWLAHVRNGTLPAKIAAMPRATTGRPRKHK
jgi:hypothetical protein